MIFINLAEAVIRLCLLQELIINWNFTVKVAIKVLCLTIRWFVQGSWQKQWQKNPPTLLGELGISIYYRSFEVPIESWGCSCRTEGPQKQAWSFDYFKCLHYWNLNLIPVMITLRVMPSPILLDPLQNCMEKCIHQTDLPFVISHLRCDCRKLGINFSIGGERLG